ncbi:MAG: hypothetical protein PVF58_10630 [Candidatus Methanofastidiosia archaeon]|jgi:tetratricopeptide (TPR) repeat protein
MKKKILALGIGFLFLLSLISAEESEPKAEYIPAGVPPTIDGVISDGEWCDANAKFVELSSDGKTINAERYFKYDDETFYFSLVVKGENKEVYLWLGDNEDQAFQKGTDLKRCLRSDGYVCSDWHYKELYDFVEDDQKDVIGRGIYNAETDSTTVEFKIPFDSGDEDDYRIYYGESFTIVYGCILDEEYMEIEIVLTEEKIAENLEEIAEAEEELPPHLKEKGAWEQAEEYWEREAEEWEKAAKFWRKKSESYKKEGNQKEAEEAENCAKIAEGEAEKAKENAEEARKEAEKAKENAEEARKEDIICIVVVIILGGGAVLIIIIIVRKRSSKPK